MTVNISITWTISVSMQMEADLRTQYAVSLG